MTVRKRASRLSRNRAKRPIETKPLAEEIAKKSAAFISIVTALGLLWGFVSPVTRISVEVIDGSWHKIGNECPDNLDDAQKQFGSGGIKDCTYEFQAKIRNYGNTPISLSGDELKLLKLCSNTPVRPWAPLQNIRLIEIIENASERKEVVIVESMMDNVLQFRKLKLLFPYFSSERINVKVKSPLADMGGVTLYAIDPIFVIQEHNKALRDACVN